ncbi:hypothetical protein ACFXA2_12065 [Micromonospora chalcea]
MRLSTVAVRMGLVVTSIVAGLVGVVLTLGTPTSPDDGGATPSPEATAPWWQDANHPPRSVLAKARIALEKDSNPLIKVDLDYEVLLNSDDPLLELVTAGKVTGPELVGRLVGGRLDESSMPTVQRGESGPARVMISGRVMPEGMTISDNHLEVLIPFEINSSQLKPDAASVAIHRSLTVQVTEMKIVAVSGSRIVEQSPTLVRIDGRPGSARVIVELEDPDSNDTPRSYPFEDLEMPTLSGTVLSALTLLTPWLALLVASWSIRRDGGTGTTIWLGASTITVGGTLVTIASTILDASSFSRSGSYLSGVTIVSAAALVAIFGRAFRGMPAWGGPSFRRILVGTMSLSSIAACIAWSQDDLELKPSIGEALGYLILVVAGAALAAAYRRRFALRGAGIGLSLALLLAISPVLTDPLVAGSASFLAMALALGLVWAYVAEASALTPRLPHYGAPMRRRLYVAGALTFLPVLQLAAGLNFYGESVLGGYFGGLSTALALLGLLLVALTVAVARQRGQRAEGAGDLVVWSLALASALIVVVDLGHLVQFSTLAAGSFLLLWWLLVPHHKRSRGIALSGVTPSTHTALVKAEMRRRLMELSAHDVYRSARTLLRDGSISPGEYYRRQQRIDDAATARGRMIEGVPVSDALATAGGRPPWENARAAMLYSTPLFTLIVGYELGLPSIPYMLIINPPWQAALILAHILRWIAYAAIFGYFYSLIRGRTPVAKAMVLVFLMLPAELLSVLSLIESAGDSSDGRTITTPDELLLALGLRTGQALVFCTVLGLAWERRMAMLAGYRWDRLRNIRSLRALATPAGTVIVAIATALGTALAGTAVAALLTTGTSTPASPQPTPSSSQSPK